MQASEAKENSKHDSKEKTADQLDVEMQNVGEKFEQLSPCRTLSKENVCSRTTLSTSAHGPANPEHGPENPEHDPAMVYDNS